MISASLPVRLGFPARFAEMSNGTKLRRHWVYPVLASALSVGSIVAAQAHPMDSPETVYIDGVPCNGACQSYMAWSRKTLEQNSGSPRSVTERKAGKTRMTSVAPKRLASRPPTKRSVPIAHEAPRDQTAGLEYLVPVPDDHPALNNTATTTQTAALETQPATPQIQAQPPADLSDKTVEAQIQAATLLADRVTASATPAVDENKEVAANATPAQNPGTEDDTGKPPRAPDRVVLILARAEIKSIADLANKDIAIEDKQAQFREQIRTGIVAAGAPMIELRDGNASAIDRLVSGEQPAAILTVASPEAADWFPEIKGFRTFRIPLSPS